MSDISEAFKGGGGFRGRRMLELRAGSSLQSKIRAPRTRARLLATSRSRNRYTFSTQGSEPYSKGPYVTRIEALEGKGRLMASREVEVSCTCPYWQYYGADFNALENDYSERRHSNGAPPEVRDPLRANLVCKHIVAAVRIAKDLPVPDQADPGEIKEILVKLKRGKSMSEAKDRALLRLKKAGFTPEAAEESFKADLIQFKKGLPLQVRGDLVELDSATIAGRTNSSQIKRVRTGRKGGHRHTAMVNETGDGTTTVEDGHMHDVVNWQVVPGGKNGHTHSLPSTPNDTPATKDGRLIQLRPRRS